MSVTRLSWKTIAAAFYYLLLVLILAGLFVVNWYLALWFAGGCILWIIVFLTFKLLPRIGARGVTGILIIVAVIVLGILLFLPLKAPPIQAEKLPVGTVTQYRVVIKPLTKECETFEVRETGRVTEVVIPPVGKVAGQKPPPKIVVQPQEVSLDKKRTVQPTDKGWFVREIQLRPFDPDAPEYVTETVFGGKDEFAHLAYDSPEPWVSLRDLPAGTFCQARDAKADPSPYGKDKENVSWQLHTFDPERGIAFLFVRPPFNGQRWWVNHVLFVDSWPRFLVALVGLILSGVPALLQKGAEAGAIELAKMGWAKLKQRWLSTPPPPPAGPAIP